MEGTWRSHQVPLTDVRTNADHLRLLEEWLRSYRPEELFDTGGRVALPLDELVPRSERRMSALPHANGGLLLRDLDLPDFRDYAFAVKHPGHDFAESTRVLGAFLRDVVRRNPDNFRLFGPDETASNRLGDVFEATGRAWVAATKPTDEGLSPDGRVMEVLWEHLCQGWLEGYLLTGRHGLFNCYEAFIHIIDSMFNQHAKWLKATRALPWRRPIASLNYLLSSHVWRQDHNGFSHQDPGFIDHVVNKKAEIIRVYLPRREHAAVGRGPLPPQPRLRERDRGRQATGVAVLVDGRGDPPLHARHRYLGMGVERCRLGAGCRPRLLRRRAHSGDLGGGGDPPRTVA